MLTISGLSKAFGEKTLFDEVNLQINEGDRIAIVGPNGRAKRPCSPFCLVKSSLIMDKSTCRGTERSATYRRKVPRCQTSLYLSWRSTFTPEIPGLRKFLSEHQEDDSSAVSHDDGTAYARYEELGGHTLEVRAKKILMGLGFKESDFNRSLQNIKWWVDHAHSSGSTACDGARPFDAG